MRRFLGFDAPPCDQPDPVFLITDQSTKAVIAEALGWANQSAKRQVYVIETFTTDPPTLWTQRHRMVDQLLTDWERASS